MSPTRVFLATICILLLSACAQSEKEPGPEPTEVSPQPGVPASALPVAGDLALGRIQHALGPNPDVSEARTVEGLSCGDDLLVVQTDVETLYASMPCDRFLAAEAVQRLVGQPAAIRLDAGDGQRLTIDSTGGTAEFSVLSVWIEER